MTTKPPLRPATPIDAELAKPHPEDMTELEKLKQDAEAGELSDKPRKPTIEKDTRRPSLPARNADL